MKSKLVKILLIVGIILLAVITHEGRRVWDEIVHFKIIREYVIVDDSLRNPISDVTCNTGDTIYISDKNGKIKTIFFDSLLLYKNGYDTIVIRPQRNDTIKIKKK